jgi:UDP-N-acetylenolpyruvoylglucosamine reductase
VAEQGINGNPTILIKRDAICQRLMRLLRRIKDSRMQAEKSTAGSFFRRALPHRRKEIIADCRARRFSARSLG